MNGIYRTTQPTLNDGDIEQLQIDESGNLRVAIQSSTAGGDASLAEQEAQTSVLEQILEKQQEASWIPKWAEVITSIPPGGIDVTALVPAPYKAFKIEIAANAPGSGNLVYELAGRPGYLVTWFTGPYGGEFGEISKIDGSTSPNLLPMKLSAR